MTLDTNLGENFASLPFRPMPTSDPTIPSQDCPYSDAYTANGQCNLESNTPACGYDGGECCTKTGGGDNTNCEDPYLYYVDNTLGSGFVSIISPNSDSQYLSSGGNPSTQEYTAEVTDGYNNKGVCTFSVTVQDNEDPVWTCPQDVFTREYNG